MAKFVNETNNTEVRYVSEPTKGKFGIRGIIENEHGVTFIRDYPYLATMYTRFAQTIDFQDDAEPDSQMRTPFRAYWGMCNKRFRNLEGVVIRHHIYRSVQAVPGGYAVNYIVDSITGDDCINKRATAMDSLVLLTSESLLDALGKSKDMHDNYVKGAYGKADVRHLGETCIIMAIYNDSSYSVYFGKDVATSIMNFERVHGMVPYVPSKKDAMNSSVAAYRSNPLPVKKKSFVRSEDGFLVIR